MFGFSKKSPPAYWFAEPENTACFTCGHVLDRTRPILLALHEQDGAWQFLCGAEDHSDANMKLLALSQVVALDGTVNKLHEMPLGVGAERDRPDAHWIAFKRPNDGQPKDE